MQPYIERATDVASESQIAVQVLLSRANDSIELIPLKPHALDGYIAPEEFAARQLRSVGFVGLCGLKPLCAFKEPLDPPIVEGIAAAFLEYVRVLLGGSFAECMVSAEVSELERLFLLEDTRPEA